ncbi:polysaccharide lyase 8 family protein [Glycomyces harbinensis]|uniref:Hyaluronate lyase n=1 Tax=Glycomyces harbinensis TaxID=58114 RepID=A0A1G6RTM9_9ACTN|nr:polysaccharide lyase 8 family protein [Glycomyces harbinensis]SDD07992.1 hyaluronate lyase [Glycomyces harbinensis]
MPPRTTALTRRLLIGGGLGLSGAAVAAGLLAMSRGETSGTLSRPGTGVAFPSLIDRARTLITGGDVDPDDEDYTASLTSVSAAAAGFLGSMDLRGSRTTLWSDLGPAADPAGFNTAYSRLFRLALAWATPGADQYGDEAVAGAVTEALSFLYQEAFNEDAEQSGNWYWWEIGSPWSLMRTCVLLREEIPPAHLRHYLDTVDRWCPDASVRLTAPDESETGANRADKAAILALRGIVGEEPAKLRLARDGLSDTEGDGEHGLFRTVESGDGFHADGSFIQHGTVAYTGAYGTTLLDSAGFATALLAGSVGEVTDPDLPVLLDAVEHAFAPFVEDGLLMDCVRGRSIARPRQQDSHSAVDLVGAVTQLAEIAPDDYRSRWHALVKGWIERSAQDLPYFETAGVAAVRRAKTVLADDSLEAAPRPDYTRVFAGMDRLVVRRPGWSWALSMSSNRVAAYETGNGENLRGWYTGDGMAYLYLPEDPVQYSDAFWPTADPHRLPGTTVDTRAREPRGADEDPFHLPANDVAGGAVLGERHAVAAMDLIAEGSSLRAKKSWFVVGDAITALGAGITAYDGRTVQTTVEHRNRHGDGDRRITVDGVAPSGDGDLTTAIEGARWAHLPGVAGYVFPSGSTGLTAAREVRTGAWNDIEQGATTGGGDLTAHTRRYASLWYDHGVSPADAAYAYTLLPKATEDETAAWAEAPAVEVLANTTTVQAVESPSAGLIAAHFWQAGEAGGLACDGPASVLVRRTGDGINVSVADPGRTAETVTIELPYPASELVESDDTVTAEPGDRPKLTIAVGGSRGATHTALLR